MKPEKFLGFSLASALGSDQGCTEATRNTYDPFQNISYIPCPVVETPVRCTGGQAGAAGGHLLVVVGAVLGARGIPPQAQAPVRREPKLPRPRKGLLRPHRRARAFQTVSGI